MLNVTTRNLLLYCVVCVHLGFMRNLLDSLDDEENVQHLATARTRTTDMIFHFFSKKNITPNMSEAKKNCTKTDSRPFEQHVCRSHTGFIFIAISAVLVPLKVLYEQKTTMKKEIRKKNHTHFVCDCENAKHQLEICNRCL